jgi:hypothetical protein
LGAGEQFEWDIGGTTVNLKVDSISGKDAIVTLTGGAEVCVDDPNFNRDGKPWPTCANIFQSFDEENWTNRCNRVDTITGLPVSNYCKESCSQVNLGPCATASPETPPPTASPVTPPPTAPPVTPPPTASPVTPPPTAPPVTPPPTASPVTQSPSATPSGPVSCEDDPTFRYKGHEWKTCAWVGKKDTRRTTLCARNGVRENCPETCDNCNPAPPAPSCVDDPTFRYRGRERNTCAWVGKKDTRRNKLCARNGVRNNCPETCDNCP